MTDSISRLIEIARAVKMTESDREAQRRSFAYGNTAIENDRITRELIDQEADKLQGRGDNS